MAPHLVLALALSTLIGVSLGLLGGGGSILAVPVLVYVARVDVHSAIGMSLAIVGATTLVGGLVHARAGRVDLRAAALFGAAGMLGAPLGAQATHADHYRVLLLLFAALMLAVGGLMLRGTAGAHPGTRGPTRWRCPPPASASASSPAFSASAAASSSCPRSLSSPACRSTPRSARRSSSSPPTRRRASWGTCGRARCRSA